LLVTDKKLARDESTAIILVGQTREGIRIVENLIILLLPDIIKKQAKSLTAQVVMHRCFEPRRDRLYRQLDEIHQVVFVLTSAKS
jgi:hypothetical protein